MATCRGTSAQFFFWNVKLWKKKSENVNFAGETLPKFSFLTNLFTVSFGRTNFFFLAKRVYFHSYWKKQKKNTLHIHTFSPYTLIMNDVADWLLSQEPLAQQEYLCVCNLKGFCNIVTNLKHCDKLVVTEVWTLWRTCFLQFGISKCTYKVENINSLNSIWNKLTFNLYCVCVTFWNFELLSTFKLTSVSFLKEKRTKICTSCFQFFRD